MAYLQLTKVKILATTVLARDWEKDTITCTIGGHIHVYNIYGKQLDGIHQHLTSKGQKSQRKEFPKLEQSEQ